MKKFCVLSIMLLTAWFRTTASCCLPWFANRSAVMAIETTDAAVAGIGYFYDKNFQLGAAINAFDDKKVAALLEQGVAVDALVTEDGINAFELVIMLGVIQENQEQHKKELKNMLRLLLKHGANPNQTIGFTMEQRGRSIMRKPGLRAMHFLAMPSVFTPGTTTLFLAKILADSPKYDPFTAGPRGLTDRQLIMGQTQPIIPVPVGDRYKIAALLEKIEKKRIVSNLAADE